jgi:UDP-N-acetyl-D-mannosaminuronate dehydrogenase
MKIEEIDNLKKEFVETLYDAIKKYEESTGLMVNEIEVGHCPEREPKENKMIQCLSSIDIKLELYCCL